MRRTYLLTLVWIVYGIAWCDDLAKQAWELETKGEAAEARGLLERAVAASPKDVATAQAWAEYLARHRDPDAARAYERLLALDGADRKSVAHALVTLELLAGNRAQAERHLEAYRAAGGTDLTLGTQTLAAISKPATIAIPGPLRSFSRMAALAPDIAPTELLAALARNVVTNGYQAVSSAEGLEPTEYLKLVVRYLSQARELEKLAGATKQLRIDTCESAQTADLLRVLGYRMRGGCGTEVVLETVNASRAFLTIDSGFPLAELEQSLRNNRPFVLDYQPAEVPVLYGPDYWLSARDKGASEFIDYFISDPSVCRLYLGISKLDPDTAEHLRRQMSVQRIRTFAHVLDFFGGMFEIRNGRAMVPGGARSEKAWADLAGSPPEKGAAFFEKLLVKDDGWLASYFDSLARITGPVQTYLTEPDRMKRFYAAMRGKITSPGPARPVFRANTDLMMLTTRLRLDANGKPHIPGSLDIWKGLFVNHPHGKYDGKLTKSAAAWKESDDVLEALFALCRKAVENEPLKIFMGVSDIERRRGASFQPQTVDRLARAFRTYGAQYSMLAEVPSLRDETVLLFLETSEAISRTKDQGLRADQAGTMQALVSIWQILCRQGAIPVDKSDSTLAALLGPFGAAQNARDLFDAGRGGLKTLLTAAGTQPNASVHDRLLDLMAGAASPADADTHSQVVQDMIRLFEAQRLISLDTIFALADNLDRLPQSGKLDQALVAKLAARIAEIQAPRAALSSVERNSLAFGYWSEKHIDTERKVNLRALADKADPKKLQELRGALAPFLRDTLVGAVYLHYAPPGAQILHTNPAFVRSHDFIGMQGVMQTWKATEVFGSGWPANAGGRLVGSLSGLPYALAEAEQNFLIPTREQALIWGDLVPQLLISATIPRWWNISPAQLHYVGAAMAYGEEQIAEAALNAQARERLLAALDRQAPPVRVRLVERLLASGDVQGAAANLTPAEVFLMSTSLSEGATHSLAAEMRRVAAEYPALTSPSAISRAFGTPKPTLTNSYVPELLNLRTFPTLMGYSSRMLAESWESNLLYYAALADEIQLPPAQLNLMIPQWTQQTVEKIFATHLEDWPALLRSLRMVGDDVRRSHRQTAASAGGAQ